MTAFQWLVKDSPIESPWLRGTKTFGVSKPVMLIDQFGGKQPYLINQQYWEAGELSYPACVKAVVAHIDDINMLSFLDYLRQLAISGSRQIFFATADTKLAGLFRHKFRFLGEEFKELRLSRTS